MFGRAPMAFLLIVGLSITNLTHAEGLVPSGVDPSSAPLKSFIVDFDSASLQKRQALGIDLDSEGISDARSAAAEALPRELGEVKRSWLIVFDSAAFEPGFFDGSILLELPTGQSCVAHALKITEPNDYIQWIGQCDSSISSGDLITLNIYPKKQKITGFIRWGRQYFDISSTRQKPFHVIYEHEPDYVPERPVNKH